MTGEIIQAKGIGIAFEAHCGFISSMTVEDEGRNISLMHRAPWIGSNEAMPPEAAPHLARLSGDYFCAPFGDASADGAPIHGWPANSTWRHLNSTRLGKRVTATYELERHAMGARLTKHLTLIDGHPFVYQLHRFEGGQGSIAVANHAMVDVAMGASLSFSKRLWFETPQQGLETDPARGRSKLQYPAMSLDPQTFPMAGGRTANLTRYPFAHASEEFVVAIEARDSPLGWTAVARDKFDDLFLSLRNPSELPMTMMWHSNGGRDYAPWFSRHIGVLGIEEGLNAAMCGYSNAQHENLMRQHGLRLSVDLAQGKVVEVRHIIGSMAWAGASVVGIARVGDALRISGQNGHARTVPCDLSFLALAATESL